MTVAARLSLIALLILSPVFAQGQVTRPLARPEGLGEVKLPHLRPTPRISAMGGELSGSEAEARVFLAVQTVPSLSLRPAPRRGSLPRTRWEHQKGSGIWTRAALSALKGHAKPLVSMVPKDIEHWCPAYPDQGPEKRAAFWVGFMSALAKHESTYRATAVGGGGRWYGLLQIYPDTARRYGCRARTGEALKNGAANLSCAARIMAVTVRRDGVVGQGGRGGVAADWGPMVHSSKRADIAAWTRKQSYCVPMQVKRPMPRPKLG
ncbi:transglycosylase SLT domain-containing protein [Alphaproteobacteria bacterium KMM 3653]|uniref:Transglycosylase SLT domain-containing protein n=1 Tax=Harenicola maris TaxID=2841044 RepID=A0AAP2CNC4_9RHOB|nr:transglycosylase SLT domain-containing protein [Harenicola maris]